MVLISGKIPPRGSDQSLGKRPNRVKGSLGSFNTGGDREPACGSR